MVEDEGPGLASSANLFVPFFTTKPQGSGIGLVLCRQIAEAHGGLAVARESRRPAGMRGDASSTRRAPRRIEDGGLDYSQAVYIFVGTKSMLNFGRTRHAVCLSTLVVPRRGTSLGGKREPGAVLRSSAR